MKLVDTDQPSARSTDNVTYRAAFSAKNSKLYCIDLMKYFCGAAGGPRTLFFLKIVETAKTNSQTHFILKIKFAEVKCAFNL